MLVRSFSAETAGWQPLLVWGATPGGRGVEVAEMELPSSDHAQSVSDGTYSENGAASKSCARRDERVVRVSRVHLEV